MVWEREWEGAARVYSGGAICNHQVDSPFYSWPDLCSSDLQAKKRVPLYMKRLYMKHPREGHSLCQVVHYARLYMGCFSEIFCVFLCKMGTFFEQNVCAFPQGGYLFLRNLLHLLYNR